MAQIGSYPLTFTVDYPNRQLNRLSSALRIFYAIPILLLLTIAFGRFGPHHTVFAAFTLLFFPVLFFAGGALWHPLTAVHIFGLLFAPCLTLGMLPTLYYVFCAKLKIIK